MKTPTMCPNENCEQYGRQRSVLGGCECGASLVEWNDPTIPTIPQIASIVMDVARLEGKPVPRREVERILRDNRKIQDEWIARLDGVDWRTRLAEIDTEALERLTLAWDSGSSPDNSSVSFNLEGVRIA